MTPRGFASKVTNSPKTMKNPYLVPLAALVMFTAAGCDKSSPDIAKKISELEQRNLAAEERQRDLERQIEDQKLASERDAIERERAKIEEDRTALELRKGEAAAAKDEALRDRENALADREGRLDDQQTNLERKQDDILARGQELSERDQELAGREALPFQSTQQSVPVGDYGMFYDSLSSYGSWFETPDYGYVWQPVVVRETNWRPYSRGRWVCSDRGWTWVSEEPFGWATYHYGRWALLRGRGWIWVPGSQWAPSWVSWRENNSHIGWAPLPPETLAYRGQSWNSGVDIQFSIGASSFNFVSARHFGSPVYRHCLPRNENVGIFGKTTNITNIHIDNRQVICGGPRYKDMSARVGRSLPFYRLDVNSNPRPSRDPLAMRPRFQGDRLAVCAPNLDASWNDRLKPVRIKERMKSVSVERSQDLSKEISNRYRESREEGRQNADQAITKLGGREKFDQRRLEKLQENRREMELLEKQQKDQEVALNPDRQQEDPAPKIEPGKQETVVDGRPRDGQGPDKGLQEIGKGDGRPNRPNDAEKPGKDSDPSIGRKEDTPQEPAQTAQKQADATDGVAITKPERPLDEDALPPGIIGREKPKRPEKPAKASELAQDLATNKPLEPTPAELIENQPVIDPARDTSKEKELVQKEAIPEKLPATEQVIEKPKEVIIDKDQEQVQQEKPPVTEPTREVPKQVVPPQEQAREAQKEAMQQQQQEQAQQKQQDQQAQAEQAREAQKEAMQQQRQEQAQQRQLEQQAQAEQAREAQREAMQQRAAQEREQQQEQQRQQQIEQQRQQQQEQQRQQQMEQQRQQQQEQQRQQQMEQQQQQEQQRQQQEQQRQQQEQQQQQGQP